MCKTAHIFFLPVLGFMLAACFPRNIRAYSGIYRDRDTTIVLSAQPEAELSVLYTGCGGLLIHSAGHSVLVDPFYSYKGLSMVWQKLATDKEATNEVFRKIDAQCGGIAAIENVLIAHSHYDHLMDLPYVLNTHLTGRPVTVIGSGSTRNALSAMHLSPYSFYQPTFGSGGCFDERSLNTRMKLKIIPSGHAPHLRMLGLPLQGMRGSIGCKGVKGFDAPDYKAHFSKWKEGEDYSFLIELEREGGVAPFRIFIQSSSCKPPAGIPDLAENEQIDLAFIGVASANNVADYPMALLKAIKPRYVVFIHWEDFFRSYERSPKIVRATSFKTFLSRYRNVMGEAYAYCTLMPRQGTLLRFQY